MTNIHRIRWEQSVTGNADGPSWLLCSSLFFFCFVFKCEFLFLLIILKYLNRFLSFFLILKITLMRGGRGIPAQTEWAGNAVPVTLCCEGALYTSRIFPFRFVRLFYRAPPPPPFFLSPAPPLFYLKDFIV